MLFGLKRYPTSLKGKKKYGIVSLTQLKVSQPINQNPRRGNIQICWDAWKMGQYKSLDYYSVL